MLSNLVYRSKLYNKWDFKACEALIAEHTQTYVSISTTDA